MAAKRRRRHKKGTGFFVERSFISWGRDALVAFLVKTAAGAPRLQMTALKRFFAREGSSFAKPSAVAKAMADKSEDRREEEGSGER